MRLCCIACEVLARPLYLSAARSPHIVDIQLFRRGLHNDPADLRTRLQAAVDEASGRALADGRRVFDAIAMGYGLCGQATAGLIARDIPVVVPRAHDCITLFLGSRAEYQHQFEDFSGTYWYAQDYVERDDGTGGVLALGAGTSPISTRCTTSTWRSTARTTPIISWRSWARGSSITSARA